MFQNGVLNIRELPFGIADTLPDNIALCLQLTHSRTNAIHAILADFGEAFRGVVPIFREESMRDNSPLALSAREVLRKW